MTGVDQNEPYAWMEGDVEQGPGVYDIPIWALLPKREEASNLLVVASPSASHIGMSTLRMESQFMIMGQSAGTIAALGLQTVLAQGKPIHEVDTALLHRELLKGGQLMNAACGLPGPAPPPLRISYYLAAFHGLFHQTQGVIWVDLAEKSGHILCNWQQAHTPLPTRSLGPAPVAATACTSSTRRIIAIRERHSIPKTAATSCIAQVESGALPTA